MTDMAVAAKGKYFIPKNSKHEKLFTLAIKNISEKEINAEFGYKLIAP